MAADERCWGCGASVAASDGPTHRYIGASAGCWALYNEVLLRPGIARGQMLVDAYAAQHSGVPGPQSSQSVAVHLMSLCAQLERSLAPEHATARMHVYLQSRSGRRPTFEWLDPPPPNGSLTIVDIHAAAGAELNPLIERWAREVYTAWSAYHPKIRAWLDAASL